MHGHTCVEVSVLKDGSEHVIMPMSETSEEIYEGMNAETKNKNTALCT